MNWIVFGIGYVVILIAFFYENAKMYKEHGENAPWFGNVMLMVLAEGIWILTCCSKAIFGV